MTAVGTPEEGARAEPEPGPWASLATALRLIVGWLCVAISLLNLTVELDRGGEPPDVPYLYFHAMLLVGGAVLIALSWMRPKPGAAGYLAGAMIAWFGMLISAVPATGTACCMRTFSIRHGYPFTFLARNAGGHWHVDAAHVLADQFFWALLGLLVLVVVAFCRRRPDPGHGHRPARTAGSHAEARAHAAEQTREQQPAD
jgi:hypothetical protein